MGRSQETFNKKEKEKLKLKKRQEKMHRKEERKSNAPDGTLENMMVYVDEFGQLTDTPPDPSTRKKVNADSIELGVPKREDDPQEKIRTGKVTFYNSSKGYGFIKDLVTQENIFVHVNAVLEPIDENDKVTFEVMRGPKGFNAVNVKKA